MLKISTIITQKVKAGELSPRAMVQQRLIKMQASQLLANREMPAKAMEVKEAMLMLLQLRILIANSSIKPPAIPTQQAQQQ